MAAQLPPEAVAFLAETRVAVIATVGPDGAPHTAPIWFLWDDEARAAVLFTSHRTRKWRNIEASPRVSLCIDRREPPYAAVILEGRAEEVVGRSLYDDVRRMAVAYYGEVDGTQFAEGYRGERGDIAHFRIVPDRVVYQHS